MLDKLKAIWSKWKIQITVVGGALVIATTYGTCTVEPVAEEVSAAPTAAAVETTNVNSVEETTTQTAETTSDAGEANESEAATENTETTAQ